MKRVCKTQTRLMEYDQIAPLLTSYALTPSVGRWAEDRISRRTDLGSAKQTKDARERNRTADLRISDAFHQDTSATPYHLATRAFDEKVTNLGVTCTARSFNLAAPGTRTRPPTQHAATLLSTPTSTTGGRIRRVRFRGVCSGRARPLSGYNPQLGVPKTGAARFCAPVWLERFRSPEHARLRILRVRLSAAEERESPMWVVMPPRARNPYLARQHTRAHAANPYACMGIRWVR